MTDNEFALTFAAGIVAGMLIMQALILWGRRRLKAQQQRRDAP